jgi:signal peptidase I
MSPKNFLEKLIYGGGLIFDLCKWTIIVVIIIMIINTYFVSIFLVDGESMEPNLHNREGVIWAKSTLIYGKASPERFEIALVKYPGDPQHKQYVKRVIGLPGETIKIISNQILVNNKPIEENFLPPLTETSPDGSWQLKADEYFLMGDNREASNDSRFFGPVEKRFILGKALFVIFPRFLLVKDM